MSASTTYVIHALCHCLNNIFNSSFNIRVRERVLLMCGGESMCQSNDDTVYYFNKSYKLHKYRSLQHIRSENMGGGAECELQIKCVRTRYARTVQIRTSVRLHKIFHNGNQFIIGSYAVCGNTPMS